MHVASALESGILRTGYCNFCKEKFLKDCVEDTATFITFLCNTKVAGLIQQKFPRTCIVHTVPDSVALVTTQNILHS